MTELITLLILCDILVMATIGFWEAMSLRSSNIISIFLTSQTFYSSLATASDLDSLCLELQGFYTTLPQCNQIFNQDSRAKTANYNELATISIDILTTNAIKLHSSIDTALNDNASDNPITKNVLQMCSKFYSEGESKIKEAKEDSVAKNYQKAADDLTLYSFSVQACIDEFNKGRQAIPVVTGLNPYPISLLLPFPLKKLWGNC